MGVLCFFCWYYPIGLQQNGVIAGNLHGRGACAFLFVWIFMVFTSTFGHMVIAAFETADAAAAINNAFFILMFAFAGYVLPTMPTQTWAQYGNYCNILQYTNILQLQQYEGCLVGNNMGNYDLTIYCNILQYPQYKSRDCRSYRIWLVTFPI